jgi:crotonobetainyl-CoA:carnitine CoA-transferase CaiB-like acyl-CoA transferase
VVVGSPKQWAGFKALMRNPDIFEAEWATRTSDREPNVFRMVAQERLTDRTRAELFTEALGYGATVGVLHQPSEFVAHPQTRTRKFFTDSNCTG